MNSEEDKDNFFRALSSPLRRKIISYLGEKGESSYMELLNSMNLTLNNAGKFVYHLKLLKGAKIIEKNGRNYSLTKVRGYKALELVEKDLDKPTELYSISEKIKIRKELAKIEKALEKIKENIS